MHGSTWTWPGITFMLLGHTHGQGTRSVEVPIGKAGEVQVAEIVARLARASGLPIERPAAEPDPIDEGLSGGPDQDVALRDAWPRG